MSKWKPIKGYEGRYEVSDMGEVRVLKKWDVNARKLVPCNAIMKPFSQGKYLVVSLHKGPKRTNFYVHRLVADAFIGISDGMVVDHLDYDTRNNKLSNLRVCTQLENVKHSICNMIGKKPNTTGATGEFYICKRGGRFRVTIRRKEYPSFATLEEAIAFRDKVLREGVV